MAPSSSAPGTSIRLSVGSVLGARRGTITITATIAASPIGTLTRKSQRQPFSSPASAMIRPPRTGPIADETETVRPKTPKARARSGPRKSCWISPEFCGVSSPALAPWASRASTTSAGVRREPDRGARGDEERQPDQHQPASAVRVAEPAAGDQGQAEGERVARDDPLDGAGRGVQPLAHRRDRDVDDRDVEQRHEPDDQRDPEDPPAPGVGRYDGSSTPGVSTTCSVT